MSISEKFSSDAGDLYLASLDQGQIPDFLRQTFIHQPRAKVTLASREELSDTLQWASEHQISVIARGSGSSGFGQILPRNRSLILDLSFFNRILEVNIQQQWARVEGGVRWSDLDHYLETDNLAIASYPSSYYTTVAGWINTGGIGLCSYQFGPIKNQILELEIMDISGKTHRLKPGDDAFQAYFSSEGQLGILLNAVIKLRSRPKEVFPYLITFDDSAQAFEFIKNLNQSGLSIADLTYLSKEKIHHLEQNLKNKMDRKNAPMNKALFEPKESVFALVENPNQAKKFEEYLKKLDLPSTNRAGASLAWFERFYPMKGKGAKNFFLGNEAIMPLNQAAAYIKKLRQVCEKNHIKEAAFEAHAIKPSDDQQCLILAYFPVKRSETKILTNLGVAVEFDLTARRHQGRIYGIGIYKTPLLSWRFSWAEISRLKKLKSALDPQSLLNPGKFFSWGQGLTGVKGWIWILISGLAPLGMKLLAWTAPWLDSFLGEKLSQDEKPYLDAIDRDPVLKSAQECVQCGFCLPICPAYLTTKDEKTTARGKLQLYAASKTKGLVLSAKDNESAQLCMHCAGCTKVCQSEIDLVPAWHRLEGAIVDHQGQAADAISEFVKSVEKNPNYHRLLREGVIVEEAPRGVPALQSGL